MQTRVVLGSEDAFKRAKDALVWLWEHRDGDLHEIEIKEWKKKRSSAANNFYWGCVVNPLSESLGYTPAEMHNELLGAVFGWKSVVGLDKCERQIPNRRTTEPEKMSVEDF